MVQIEVPATYVSAWMSFAKWKDHSEEQNNIYLATQI